MAQTIEELLGVGMGPESHLELTKTLR